MIDIVYWINLDRANNRREHMKNVFQHPFFNDKITERFSAYDYKTENVLDWFTIDGEPVDFSLNNDTFFMKIMKWRYFKNMGFVKKWREKRREAYNKLSNKEKIKYCNVRLSKGEYACSLSHLETIRRFSTTSYNIALIFEDDVTMDYEKYWKKPLEQIINDAPENWEILQLCFTSNNHLFNDEYTPNKNNVINDDNSEDAYSTGAYLIKKSAAIKLIDMLYNENKYNLDHNYHHSSDFLLYYLLITYIYKYPYFTYRTENDSYIHPDHLSGHIKSKNFITNCYERMEKIPMNNYNFNWINIIYGVIREPVLYNFV